MNEKIVLKNPQDLKQHSMNVEIYGKEEVDFDLLSSIKTEGILNPIIVLSDNTILSGTRRVETAKALGMTEVPCIIRTFGSEVEEKIALLSFNKSRVKTYIQEMREIDAYEELRKVKDLPVSHEETAVTHNVSKGTFHRKRQVWNTAKKEAVTEEQKAEKTKAKNLIKKLETDPKYTPSKAYQHLQEYRNSVKVREARKEASEKGGQLQNADFLHLGNFVEVLDPIIPDGTVDAFITDPPYPYGFIDCWRDLGKFAEKKLRPGGWLVAYSGQKHLPTVMSKLSEATGLNYYWTMALYHNGIRQDVWGVELNVMWKPILIYVKPPALKLDIKQRGDYIVSRQEEKVGHEWQQSESSVAELITTFTREGDLILEPFAGSGTTLFVANKMGRRCIGAEIDVDTYNIAKARLIETPEEDEDTKFIF